MNLSLRNEAENRREDKLLEYLVTKHQKFESSILYIQNYVSDLEETSNQLFACFIIYCILHCDILQIRSFIKALTSFASYISNRLKACRDYIMSISSITSSLLLEASVNYRFNDFDIKYFSLAHNRYHNTDISIHIKDLEEVNRYLDKMLRILNIFSFLSICFSVHDIWYFEMTYHII